MKHVKGENEALKVNFFNRIFFVIKFIFQNLVYKKFHGQRRALQLVNYKITMEG